MQTKMGIFPEIDRAWITVDNSLYFWNYRNGSDFHTFDQLDQAITSVALVPPKRGMFIDSITHVLVLSTTKDLYLIAISYNKEKNELELFETGMNLSVSGLEVSTIVASKTTGRIFLAGKSHGVNISEVDYTNVETWFKGKCTRICHTGNPLASVIPSITGYDRYQLHNIPLIGSLLSQSTPETVTSIVIDDSRSLLYTLSNFSTIRMYYMDPKSTSLTHKSTYTLSQIVSHIQMIPTPAHQLGDDVNKLSSNKSFSIVSIQVIESVESSRLNLIAITSTGSRIYIKAANTTSSFGPPTAMQAIQQRLPPSAANPTAATNILKDTKSLSRVFSPGYYFAVVPSRSGEPGDSVFIAAPDSGKMIFHFSTATAGANPVYYENASFLDIEGFIQEIALVTPYRNPTTTGFSNESSAQYTVQNPQIVVLTNTGIHIFTRKYPYQVFEELGQDIRSFFEFYGRTETCANALSIASRTSTFSSDECDFASKVFIEIGGKPHLKVDDENSYSLSSNLGPNSQASQFNTTSVIPRSTNVEQIRLSGRFDGIATYISRVVRTFWKSRVFNVQKVGTAKRFSHGINKKTLESTQLVLLEISEYLDKNKTFIDGLSGGPENLLAMAGRSEELSLQAEHRSLHSLVALIKSMREATAFLLLLIDESAKAAEGLESITSFLPVEARDKLEILTFKQFFSSKLGNELARELITCLINRNITDGGSVDSVSSVLQDRCVSFCSADDVIIYKALEFLRKAEFLEGNARQQKLNESLGLFKKAAGHIQFDVLKDALDEFVKLRYYPGAVDLALTAAQEEDRGNQAIGFLQDGKNPNDQRKKFMDARYRIYELVFKILEVVDKEVSDFKVSNTFPESQNTQLHVVNRLRDETYFICYSSTEEIFHFCFYDWFLSKDVVVRLLEIETPFILPYLEIKAKTDLKIANLLWTYHQKHGNFFAAAEVLFVLANSEFELPLSQRIEFLSRAKTYCSCPSPPEFQSVISLLNTNIQESLDVANIQDEILKTLKNDPDFDPVKREQLISDLDSRLYNISDLFNDFATPLGYYEIMLLIFQTTDYRGAEDINGCWDLLVDSAHTNSKHLIKDDSKPYEYISQLVQRLGQQLQLAEFVFPPDHLTPLLEGYSVKYAPDAPQGWVVDTLLSAGLSFEVLISIFNNLIERRDYPFVDDASFKILANDFVYLLNRCLKECKTLKLYEVVSQELLKTLETTIGAGALANIKRQIVQ
jgi:nuclear pore complex protein Nup155